MSSMGASAADNGSNTPVQAGPGGGAAADTAGSIGSLAAAGGGAQAPGMSTRGNASMASQQQPRQQQQQSDAGHITCVVDDAFRQQLLGVWAHAQSLQQPIVCAASGYRVFPDGR